jgi:hypothetical protein
MNRRPSKPNRRRVIKKARSRNSFPLHRSLVLDSRVMRLKAFQGIYARTGQTTYSYLQSSQAQYINMYTLLTSSSLFSESVLNTAGAPVYEYMLSRSVTFSFLPYDIIPVQGTFELTPFGLRYFSSQANDGQLPSGYFGHANPVNREFLVQQTNRPQSFTCQLPLNYVDSPTLYSCFGNLTPVLEFLSSGGSTGGICTIIQPLPFVNTISAYNPRIGTLEVDFEIVLMNSVG